MTPDLHRLVYYSRNRVPAAPQELTAAVADILAASRRNNPRVGVTGALMFNAGCFGQVLEGPRAAIEAVFERIQQDERHGDVSLLSLEPTDQRAFDSWSMAFVGAAVEESALYASLADETGYDPSRMSGDILFQALHRMALEDERSAA